MIRTERLILRPWRDDDLEPFARMNADPRVMEFYPKLLTVEETAATLSRIRHHHDKHGFGLWAIEAERELAGYVGLMVPSFQAHFSPCVEVGWRLAFEKWGRGYATEGARAACQYGFSELGLSEIVSFAVPANLRSRKVMERLGMTRDPSEDFNHPRLPGHALERHVLYRLPISSFRLP